MLWLFSKNWIQILGRSTSGSIQLVFSVNGNGGRGFNPLPDDNFRLFQTKKVCRRQFQIWWKWQKDIQTGRKHCGKRTNCSLRAISPFPKVFSKACFLGESKGVVVWEWVNPFLNKPWFLPVWSTNFLKTLRIKEKLLITSNFSFSHSVLYQFIRTSCNFHQVQNCCLQILSVWKS